MAQPNSDLKVRYLMNGNALFALGCDGHLHHVYIIKDAGSSVSDPRLFPDRG